MPSLSRRVRIPLFALALCAFGVACGRVSVNSSRMLSVAELPRPHLVLVRDYDVGAEAVKLDRSLGSKLIHATSGDDTAAKTRELGVKISKAMAEQLAADIRELGLAAERSSGTLPQGGGPYLVIRGELLSVDEGNRLRRFVIGLGAGSSQVRAQTRVSMLGEGRETPIEEFSVSSKSPAAPGAAETLGVGAAVGHLTTAAVVSGAVTAGRAVGSKVKNTIGASVSADAARGAKAISEELAKLFRNQGWIPAAEK